MPIKNNKGAKTNLLKKKKANPLPLHTHLAAGVLLYANPFLSICLLNTTLLKKSTTDIKRCKQIQETH